MKKVVKDGQTVYISHMHLYAKCVAVSALGMVFIDETGEALYTRFKKNWPNQVVENPELQNIIVLPAVHDEAFDMMFANGFIQAGVVNTGPATLSSSAPVYLPHRKNEKVPNMDDQTVVAVSHRKMRAALKHRFFHNDPESLLVEVSFNARTNEMTNDNKTTGV